MKKCPTNVFRRFEARRKVWFLFLGAKQQGERYDWRIHQLQTNKQSLPGVFRG